MIRDAVRVSVHTLCVVLVAASSLRAGPPHPAAEEGPDVFLPVPHDQQRLAGILATRMRANTEGYLEHVDPHTLLANPVSTGLFLIAAADSYAYSEHAQLKKVLDRVAHAVMKTPPQTTDPRGQASLISGLVAFSEETGEEDAIATACKIADAAIAQGSPVVAGSLVSLYRASDDERYLQAARKLAQQNAPSDDLDRFIFCNGLVSYYRQSGDEAALRKSAQAWHTVHPTVTGAPMASADATLTAMWFQWTRNLLQATGQVGYAEALEITLYNQLLAAQDLQTGEAFDAVPMSGQKQKAASGSTCAAAEAWALASVPEAIWGRVNNAIALFNYSPGRASFRLRRRTTVQIYAEGTYPQTGELTLHVEPSRDTRFHLLLRVPRWSHKFTVESGETRLIGKPGELLNLTRDWKKGDTVKIAIDRPVVEISDATQPGLFALARGPQILAVKGAAADAAWTTESVSSLKEAVDVRNSGTMFEQRFDAKGANGDLLLTPFADAVSSYRVFLPKR